MCGMCLELRVELEARLFIMIISCFQLSSGKHEKLSVLKCSVITQLFPVSLSEISVVVDLKTLSLLNYFPDPTCVP